MEIISGIDEREIVYSDHLKIKDALPIYFSKYHFTDGGYHLKWFRIKLGPLFIPLPNIKARVDAVKIHDVHHVLTGYTAVMKGEAEIGAWEIGAGCGKYWVAWLLNLGSFVFGLIFYPVLTYRAFIKGRKIKRSLYYGITYDETLLNTTVGELRDLTGISKPRETEMKDTVYFFLVVLFILCGTFLVFYSAIMLVHAASLHLDWKL